MKNPLDNASPIRLTYKEGKWTLEFESLEQVSNVVFKPVTYTVEGPDQILSALERMKSPEQLVVSAHDLIRQVTSEPDTELNLEPRDDTWGPSTSDQFAFAKKGTEEARKTRKLEAKKEALRQSLSRMRRSHFKAERIEVLERRIEDLEAKIDRMLQGQGLPAGEAQPSQDQASDEPAKIPVASVEEQQPQEDQNPDAAASEEATGQPEQNAEALAEPDQEAAGEPAEADQESEEAEQPADEAQPDPDKPQIPYMPDRLEVQSMLRMLVGNEINLTGVPKANATQFTSDTERHYASTLLDDNDEVIGAMITDLKATIYLGGGLLMMPDDILREQIKEGKPEEDVLESMSEVFNTLSSLINDIPNNPHIKVTPAKLLDASEYSWMESPLNRFDAQEEHGGIFTMLSK